MTGRDNNEGKLISLRTRETPSCVLCGAQNVDVRRIRIAGPYGAAIACFPVCRHCLRRLALDACAAYFEFSDACEGKKIVLEKDGR